MTSSATSSAASSATSSTTSSTTASASATAPAPASPAGFDGAAASAAYRNALQVIGAVEPRVADAIGPRSSSSPARTTPAPRCC
jgi:hypothetical protein